MSTTATTTDKKAVFQSSLTPFVSKIVSLIKEKHDANAKWDQEIMKTLRTLLSESVKSEKTLQKYTKRAANRKANTSPAHSFVGVNQPKSLHPELVSFMRANVANMPEDVRGIVGDIMSLNQVKKCIQALGKWAKVVDNSVYNFKGADVNPAYVSSMQRLLIDLVPAGHYKDAAGTVITVTFDEPIMTNKITKYFDHLLTVTDASKSFTGERVNEKAAQIAAAAVTSAAALEAVEAMETESTPAVAAVAAVESTETTTTETEPEVKKRKIQRKPAAATKA